MLGRTTTVRILVDDEANGRRYARWLPHGFDARVVNATTTLPDRIAAELVIVHTDAPVESEIIADHVLWVETEPGDTVPETAKGQERITLEKPIGAGSFLAAIERLAKREWYAHRLAEYAQDITRETDRTPPDQETAREARDPGALEAVVTGFDGADFRAAFRRISNPPSEFEYLRSGER